MGDTREDELARETEEKPRPVRRGEEGGTSCPNAPSSCTGKSRFAGSGEAGASGMPSLAPSLLPAGHALCGKLQHEPERPPAPLGNHIGRTSDSGKAAARGGLSPSPPTGMPWASGELGSDAGSTASDPGVGVDPRNEGFEPPVLGLPLRDATLWGRRRRRARKEARFPGKGPPGAPYPLPPERTSPSEVPLPGEEERFLFENLPLFPKRSTFPARAEKPASGSRGTEDNAYVPCPGGEAPPFTSGEPLPLAPLGLAREAGGSPPGDFDPPRRLRERPPAHPVEVHRLFPELRG